MQQEKLLDKLSQKIQPRSSTTGSAIRFWIESFSSEDPLSSESEKSTFFNNYPNTKNTIPPKKTKKKKYNAIQRSKTF